MPDPRLYSPPPTAAKPTEALLKEDYGHRPTSDRSFQASPYPDPTAAWVSQPPPTPLSPPLAGPTPRHRLPRVLVTGFSVFPGAPKNPTEQLIAHFSSQHSTGTYKDLCISLHTLVLPVEFKAVTSQLADLSSPDGNGQPARIPDVVIHFGLDAGACGIKLERLAHNACGPHADNSGICRGGRIDPFGEDTVASQLPLDAIYSNLEKKGIPVQWSDDAGGYLCNYIFYLSASKAPTKACGKGWMPEMTGFVHVPRGSDELSMGGEGMEMRVMKEAAEVVLAECCRAWMRNHSWPAEQPEHQYCSGLRVC